MAAEQKYRRLPGRRQGIISRASLWMGHDHILLVKSSWFREEYKRFYLRDIQAIVVARGPRFYLSTPMLIFAVIWLFSGFFMGAWPFSVAIAWGVLTTLMLAAWLSVSVMAGCRCRLYTAVSRDDLPSLFRTWTARRFLQHVQPRIEQVQGMVDPGWAEAERTNAGPVVAAMAPMEPKAGAAAPRRTMASDLFALALIISSAVGLATMHSRDTFWHSVNTGLTLVQLAAAVVVLMQYYRGQLQKTMQRMAVVSLVLTGVTFYVQTFSFAFFSVARINQDAAAIATLRPIVVVNQVIYAMEFLLGFLCAVVTLRGAYHDDVDIIES
jgi:hypothetical protein